MVVFASFVVIQDDTLAAHDVSQPVLELVTRWRYRLVDTPNHEFGESIFRGRGAVSKYRDRFHVGDYDNSADVVNYSNNTSEAHI